MCLQEIPFWKMDKFIVVVDSTGRGAIHAPPMNEINPSDIIMSGQACYECQRKYTPEKVLAHASALCHIRQDTSNLIVLIDHT